jgi:hypothetical protein
VAKRAVIEASSKTAHDLIGYSRGCLLSDAFCAVHLPMGLAFRVHSPSIVRAYHFVVDKYDVKNIFFEVTTLLGP